MNFKKFLWQSQIGVHEYPDLQFLLPRFECKEDNTFTVDGRTPPFCVQFCPVKGQEHIYALACEDGRVMFLNTRLPSKKSQIKVWNGHSNAIFDLCWLNQDTHLLTAAGDQTIVKWDTTTQEKVSCFRGHGNSVKTISLKPDNENIFITGARDGNIILWDSRTNADPDHKPVFSILNAHDGAQMTNLKKRARKGQAPYGAKYSNSIACVLFQDENVFLTTGASDWSIKAWDIRHLQPSSSLTPVPLFDIKTTVENHKNQGYTSLVMNPNGTTFFANCTDGTISQYKVCRTAPEFVCSYYGHLVGTYFIKTAVSCDGQFLLCGSSDDSAYIWQVSKPGVPLIALEGHNAEVTAVAWYPNDISRFITCGDDEQVLHWNIGSPYVEKDFLNPAVGLSKVLNPDDVRLPSTRQPKTPTSSSCTESPLRRTPVSAPRLTHWFTPKSKPEGCLRCECTPKSATVPEASTPIKSRSVFCELGNHDCRKVDGINSIRKTINFGSKSESKISNPAKRSKLALPQTNYSIKKFFQASPRTEV